MSIINIIDFQLREILKLLKEDLKNSNITYNYLVCENETKFLDSFSLKLYLTETKIENETLLKIICENCIKIVEMWNIDFELLPEKKLENHFFYSDESKDKLFSSELDFHAIYLEIDKLQFFTTIYGKETFIESYDYSIVTIPQITSKCINIFNFIKQSHPEINSDFTPEYYFSHYKKTKRFTLQALSRPYSNNEFKEVEINLENYLIRYKFITDKLIGSDKTEFKFDTIDHLNNIIGKQIHSKYTVLLTHAIGQIENNFQVKRNIGITLNNLDHSTELIQLLEIKTELKDNIKRAKTNIISQKAAISKQQLRALAGQKNTLKFEQEELPKYESNLIKLQEKFSQLKIKIKTFEVLENKMQPQQIEASKVNEVKKELHSHIFKNNAFEVWQYMFDEFEVKEASRSDVKFMYEEMKKEGEGLIHNTVNQKTFLDWINSTYNGLIIQKTSNHSRKPERIKTYLRAKELYKE